ncbi:MAG: dockerin type I domain-containing protein [Verrucomicrobiota bacterium]
MASTHAVILYGTGDSGANTSAPTGVLAGSGWQYEGQFGAFLGTVIASNYFITAKHIGGNVGDNFMFNAATYATTAVFGDPAGDLQIWQVAGTFPMHASIYSGAAGTETNLNLVVFGRGTQRDGLVRVGSDMHVGGWLWGISDGVQRWGTNIVGSVVTDPNYGKLLFAPFDGNAGPNEAHLSVGDSGGAVFVFNGNNSMWELAGINLAVDGPFSASSSGTNPFDAALFDTIGLFVQGDHGIWAAAPDPSGFYATEIAAHKGFIESVVMRLLSSVSRKTHGGAGTYDIDLPQTGPHGVECRRPGVANDYTIVFTFINSVSVQSASVTSGTGSVGAFTVAGNQVTVNLSGVANEQTIVVTLGNVNDGTNASNVQATMDVLVGDGNGDGHVNASDVAQIKSRIGQPLDPVNFRSDVNFNGVINASDTAIIKSNIGTGLP